MSYSIVIPTTRPVYYLKMLMESINQQTVFPDQIIIVRDHHRRSPDFYRYQRILKSFLLPQLQERLQIIATETHTDFKNFQGVSYVRNKGIKASTSDYTMIIDDDNTFDAHFASHYLSQSKKKSDTIFFPLMQRPDGSVQSTGFTSFNRRLGSPSHPRLSTQKKLHGLTPIVCCSTNCLRGPTQIFQSIVLDERMRFIYEDIEWTYRISRVFNLVCDHDMPVVHHEAQKSLLQKLYISTPDHAYQKGYNRILFVRKHASFLQSLIYRCCGFWLSSLWLLLHMIIALPGRYKLEVFQGLWMGTVDALSLKK